MAPKPTYEELAHRIQVLEKEALMRRQAEKALKESRSKLQSLSSQFEQLSLAAASMLSVKDEQIIFNMISRAIVDHSDYSRAIISLFKDAPPYRDIIGYGGVDARTIDRLRSVEMPTSWYDGVFEKGIKIGQFSYYIPHRMSHILNPDATVFGEGPVSDADDTWHPRDNLFIKMNDENHRFIGVISVDNAKSGRKPSDESVRPLEIFSNLFSQIIILKREQHHRKKLEQELIQAHKAEALGTLTGGIAHDFNNILGIIIGNTELALDDVPQWNPAHGNLEGIKSACLRAKKVVRQLLSFIHKTDMERKPVEIAPVVRDAIKLMRSTITADIDIRDQIEDTPQTILADPTQIQQVMINICSNAAQAMEENGGVLDITLKSVDLNPHEAASVDPDLFPGRYVNIRVSDTGNGIAPEDMKRIFDPYFTTKEVGKGSGLGLSVVQGMVKIHEGAVTVESLPGSKTTVNLYFPVIDKTAALPPNADARLPMGKETILFIDDEATIATLAKAMLGRLGYRVHARTDPVAALDLFESDPHAFDLVITDMAMPGITGTTLAKRILDIRRKMPIILCTGFSNKISDEKAARLGISAFELKPLAKKELAMTVRNVLDNRR